MLLASFNLNVKKIGMLFFVNFIAAMQPLAQNNTEIGHFELVHRRIGNLIDP